MIKCPRKNCLKCVPNNCKTKKSLLYCTSYSKRGNCNVPQGSYEAIYTENHKGFYSKKSYSRTFKRASNLTCLNFCSKQSSLKNPITNKANTLYPHNQNRKQLGNIDYSRLLNGNYKSKPSWKYGSPYVNLESIQN